jgi:hypothetical protein
VADWLSIEYAFKVKKIMDLINERGQITNESLDETIEYYKNENERLKSQIANTSVPADNCDKQLTLFEFEPEKFKLSANSTFDRSHNMFYRRWTFPASMNVKQDIHIDLKQKVFEKSEIEGLIEDIRKLKPKMEYII